MNINLSGVTKVYPPDIVALDNIYLRVERGEFVYVMGKSGSGKSTLLRIITREVLPTRGQVTVNKANLRSMKAADVPFYRRDIGIVSQNYQLIPHLTAYENVAFVLEAMAIPFRYVRPRAGKVLDQVGMWRRRSFYPQQLSGGEQQRVAIARALVKAPSLFVADEPTGNLDARTSADVMRLFLSINASGVTVLMATHNQNIVDEYPRRVVTLDAGRIIGDTAESEYDR